MYKIVGKSHQYVIMQAADDETFLLKRRIKKNMLNLTTRRSRPIKEEDY